jgi:hypothetical protein
MRLLLIPLSAFVLASCSNKPTFEQVNSIYYENSEYFKELSILACSLGKQDSLKRYNLKSNNRERIDKLDTLLRKTSGELIEYELGKENQCTLSIRIHAQGFAGIGQVYSYKFQIDNPEPYDKEIHTYDKISSMKKNVSFDMPLYSDAGFSGWYFGFVYNHKA